MVQWCYMNFGFEKKSIEEEHTLEQQSLHVASRLFLGEQEEIIASDTLTRIVGKIGTERVLENVESIEGKTAVAYDKYKKSFVVGGEKASMGQIVAARHLGIDIGLPLNEKASGDEKKLKKLLIERTTNDALYGELNRELASALAVKMLREDMFVAKAYEAIAKRSDAENTQPGIFAENIMIGVAESIAIDRPDLGITVIPANAYQDVHDKIDFIVATSTKRRGVGVDAKALPDESRSVGVQFTINTSKAAHKAEQIAKAKERGVHVDDIVYVAIESSLLRQAIKKWENAGKPISGPWAHLSSDIRAATLKGIFGGVLSDDQEKSLLKGI
jgi:hypothetical protein